MSFVYDKFVCFSYKFNGLNCDLKACSIDEMACSAYSTELLRLGCFYLEFSDSIREGDGERVLLLEISYANSSILN